MRKEHQELTGRMQDSGSCKEAGLRGTPVRISAFSPIRKSFLIP